MLSDLGVTRAVFERGLVSRRAREAEKRDGEVRFYVRPFLPELEVTLPSFISRPPSSVSVECRGPTARHVECRCSITTSTHYSLTLPPGTSLSLCPRSLELTEEEGRAS